MKRTHAPPDATQRLELWLEKVNPARALNTLAELAPEVAVFVVNEERDVVLWNSGAERLLGFPASKVLGRHCLTGIRCERCLQGCGIAEHKTVTGVPLTLHRADGTQVHIRKYGKAFFDAGGDFAGGIEVLVPDLTHETLLRNDGEEVLEFHGILTRDPAMRKALQIIQNVAETDATVLVRGESGTGKELVARALHLESHRSKGPFVAVNCGALTPSLLESELFGHQKGAFTGAVSDRPGIFVQANGGTLFLDEIAELPLELQPKLLRVLQERTVVPVGGTKPIPVDVRVVAATHKALREEVKAGRFREDLMYRLRVVPIFLPALRERPADVELLLQHFIDKGNHRGLRKVHGIEPEAMRALLDHSWPGNIRELQNVVEYAFAVGRGPLILLEELPPEHREAPREPARAPSRAMSPSPLQPPEPARVDEREALLHALHVSGPNLNEAARHLGVSRTTLWRLRKKYGV